MVLRVAVFAAHKVQVGFTRCTILGHASGPLALWPSAAAVSRHKMKQPCSTHANNVWLDSIRGYPSLDGL